jgi:pimeloyl-ACP methyl ester carboxylesterase
MTGELAAAVIAWAGLLVAGAWLAGLRGLSLGARRGAFGAVLGVAGLGVAGLGVATLGLTVAHAVGLVALAAPLGVVAVLTRSAAARLDPDAPFRERQRPVGEGRARLGREDADVAWVVVHGGGNDRFYGLWYLYERLLATGALVEMVELPGHGREGNDTFSLSAGRARVDAAIASVSGRRVVLLGQSLGAAFCLDAAARGADVARAIAVSAPHSLAIGGAVVREARALFGRGLYRTLRYGTVREVLPAVGGFRRDDFPVRVDGDYVAAFRRALDEMALLAHLPDARAPIDVIHGEWDGVVPVDQARDLAAAAGARLWILPGRTHLDPLLDRAVVDDILARVGEPDQRAAGTAG